MEFPHLKHKNVLIMGLGLNGGGLASARFFAEQGANITVTDLQSETFLAPSMQALNDYSIHYVLEKHRHEDFAQADIVVPNPMIKKENPYIQTAIKNGAKVQTDLHFFLENTSSPIIGVTGTRGKSTTCSLLYHIISQTQKCFLGGNITVSPFTFWQKLTPQTPVILELSSWQLRWLEDADFVFRGFVYTNFLKDHQNHYPDLQSYWGEKKIALKKLDNKSFLIINETQAEMTDFPQRTTAQIFYHSGRHNNAVSMWPENHTLWLQNHGAPVSIYDDLAALPLKGKHNQQNISAAAMAAYAFGISIATIQAALPTFQGVPFRQQKIAHFDGIKFINDTTSTTPEAAIAALDAFANPLICIIGGNDKSLEFDSLAQKLCAKNPKFIAFLEGSGTTALFKALGKNVENLIYQKFSSFEKAMEKIENIARSGDTVLLSPGCARFGMFQNEFDRGRQFNKFVEQWKIRFEGKEIS